MCQADRTWTAEPLHCSGEAYSCEEHFIVDVDGQNFNIIFKQANNMFSLMIYQGQLLMASFNTSLS